MQRLSFVFVFLSFFFTSNLVWGELKKGDTYTSKEGRVFILEEELGRGDFGSNWKVRLKGTAYRYAVKFYNKAEHARQFTQNISNLMDPDGKNKNPGIIRMFAPETVTNGEKTYLVLRSELADGGTLFDNAEDFRIRANDSENEKRTKIKRIKSLIEDLNLASKTLQNRDVSHHDANPRNLLKVGEHYKLGDADGVTEIGKPPADRIIEYNFAAPEYFGMNHWPLTHQTDLNTMGNSIYFAMTGKSPIEQFAIDRIHENISLQEKVKKAQEFLGNPKEQEAYELMIQKTFSQYLDGMPKDSIEDFTFVGKHLMSVLKINPRQRAALIEKNFPNKSLKIREEQLTPIKVTEAPQYTARSPVRVKKEELKLIEQKAEENQTKHLARFSEPVKEETTSFEEDKTLQANPRSLNDHFQESLNESNSIWGMLHILTDISKGSLTDENIKRIVQQLKILAWRPETEKAQVEFLMGAFNILQKLNLLEVEKGKPNHLLDIIKNLQKTNLRKQLELVANTLTSLENSSLKDHKHVNFMYLYAALTYATKVVEESEKQPFKDEIERIDKFTHMAIKGLAGYERDQILKRMQQPYVLQPEIQDKTISNEILSRKFKIPLTNLSAKGVGLLGAGAVATLGGGISIAGVATMAPPVMLLALAVWIPLIPIIKDEIKNVFQHPLGHNTEFSVIPQQRKIYENRDKLIVAQNVDIAMQKEATKICLPLMKKITEN